MQKTFQNPRYLWWSIQSIILQIEQDPTSKANGILVSIAERQLSGYFEGKERKNSDREESNGNNVKGKAKAVDTDEDVTEAAESIPRLPEYESSEVYHLITRFLELRATHSLKSSITTQHIPLPSLPLEPPNSPINPVEVLLTHLQSEESDQWCARQLGSEIARREMELKFGTKENRVLQKAWNRMKASLIKG